MSAEVDPEEWGRAAEARILEAAVSLARREPWSERLLREAVREAGLPPEDGALLLPNGLNDLTALLFARHDAAALKSLEGLDPASLRVRERIFTAARARIEAAMADEPAVRRVAVHLARPDRLALGAELGWRTADGLWRWAGDRSVDENHYSKRALLSGILLSTLLTRLASGPEAADAHLRARIETVMGFEKLKARIPAVGPALERAAARLGRLRYGVRARAGEGG